MTLMNPFRLNESPLDRIERALSTFTKAAATLREASSDLLDENAGIAAQIIEMQDTQENNSNAAAAALNAASKLTEITG